MTYILQTHMILQKSLQNECCDLALVTTQSEEQEEREDEAAGKVVYVLSEEREDEAPRK